MQDKSRREKYDYAATAISDRVVISFLARCSPLPVLHKHHASHLNASISIFNFIFTGKSPIVAALVHSIQFVSSFSALLALFFSFSFLIL